MEVLSTLSCSRAAQSVAFSSPHPCPKLCKSIPVFLKVFPQPIVYKDSNHDLQLEPFHRH